MNKQKMLKGLGIVDDEDKLLFSKIFDQYVFAKKKHTPQFTQFIDIGRCNNFQTAFSNISKNDEILVCSFGGYYDVERKMLGFFPKNHFDYSDNFNDLESGNINDVSEKNFPIVPLLISRKHKKFGQQNLNHRDYLGSILGLGIGREKIGDIIVQDDIAVCFVEEIMADYIVFNLEKISKTYVFVEIIDEIPEIMEKKTKTEYITVSSLRLDVILAKTFSLSRSSVQELQKKEKVSVDWHIATNNSLQIKEGMTISARGFGRFKIGEIGGINKKNKIGLEIIRYV